MKRILKRTHPRQEGATLIVALIMLMLVTMVVLTSVNLSKDSLQVVGNMQQRNEAQAAAREVVERAVSSTRFFDTPSNVFANPCNGVANSQCVDANGDGVDDVNVVLTPAPTCVKAQSIKNASLDLSIDEDKGCSLGSQQNFGTVGAATGDSLCSNSVWELSAEANDAVTQSKVEFVQGVAVRVASNAISTSCP
jgi:Tfp pilus assembly protein PilX